MDLKKVFFLIATVFIVSACTQDAQKDPTFEPGGNRDLELVKLATDEVYDQNPSNRSKEILSNYEEVSGIRAVNDKDNLLIGVDIDHHERFSLDNMESELQKKIRKNFSDLKVTLSTYQKILLEVEKLEKQIRANEVTNDELKKKIADLVSLSKEQT